MHVFPSPLCSSRCRLPRCCEQYIPVNTPLHSPVYLEKTIAFTTSSFHSVAMALAPNYASNAPAYPQEPSHSDATMQEFKEPANYASSHSSRHDLSSGEASLSHSINEHDERTREKGRPSGDVSRPSSVHFDPRFFQTKTADYSNTPTTGSTVSTRAYDADTANDILRQQLGAYDHDKSDDTLVGDFMTNWEYADPPSETAPLPEKRGKSWWREVRHRYLNAYQRLFALVLLGNIVALVVTMAQRRNATPVGTRLQSIATATAVNVTAAILMRQEYVINLLYDIVTCTPLSAPLQVRRTIAKFYHFGGVHSGCAVSALMWFTLNTVLLTKQFADGEFRSVPVLVLTYCLILLLATICLFAFPKLRFKSHNTFEAFHRFGGWTAVALFWVQTVLVCYEQSRVAHAQSLGLLLIQTPIFWLLALVTGSIILPWLRLRKIQAWPEILSQRAARIHFNYTSIGSVVGIRIANNPLKEWHPFATIPEADGSSFSILVSSAGDWTNKQIVDPCYSYWVRGVPISGILRMACIFKRVVVVTTGSGIGPCLSLLIAHPLPCRILWSTPSPEKVYGTGTIGAVMKADSEAMIVDTRKYGRPKPEQMIEWSYHLYQRYDAEAVFIVSNSKLTKTLVFALESRGIPAYGPIWDS